ncbi:Coq4-domain-containing protein [Tilletiaria anomala UBC 951]|uniref:4-hydroxy-3-methoxy-5-polyprenylbenzoate decarboxylase n=1 Tax=Tilletiaria anomala (strain ATCC 24038 / CBS 436.72 / UBC 951) TaxID=1037660 RepID=A0A066VR52_TILAU|nr:Coq4-domain-containing protein [Tilletiaria anomala UBC 951]KDN41065.1 Coq4-domain-containing protein [Tilletiaria anomala UBC 951]
MAKMVRSSVQILWQTARPNWVNASPSTLIRCAACRYISSSATSSLSTTTSLGAGTSQERQPLYEGHIHLSPVQRAFMAVGSALASFHKPARADMIAVLSEVSGQAFLPKLRDQMLQSDEGRRLLIQRPAINSETVDMNYLRSLKEGTFGKAYVDWLDWCAVSPDTREPVRYIDDTELRYVMQRYRESHDFYHLLCRMPVSQMGETVVKYFEAAHFGLPVAYLSSIAGPTRLSIQELSLLPRLVSWATNLGRTARPLIGVYWEEKWELPFDQVRKDLGMTEPPTTLPYEPRRGKSRKPAWPTRIVEAQTSSRS